MKNVEKYIVWPYVIVIFSALLLIYCIPIVSNSIETYKAEWAVNNFADISEMNVLCTQIPTEGSRLTAKRITKFNIASISYHYQNDRGPHDIGGSYSIYFKRNGWVVKNMEEDLGDSMTYFVKDNDQIGITLNKFGASSVYTITCSKLN